MRTKDKGSPTCLMPSPHLELIGDFPPPASGDSDATPTPDAYSIQHHPMTHDTVDLAMPMVRSHRELSAL